MRRQSIVRYAQWSARLMRLLWGMLLLLALCEGVIFVLYGVVGMGETALSPGMYLLTYTLCPVAVYFCITLIAQWIYRRIIVRHALPVQAGYIISVIVLLISCVAGFYCDVPVIYTVFVTPMLAAILYAEKRILAYAALLSIAGYLATLFGYVYPFAPETVARHTPVDIICQIAILLAVWLTGRLLVDRIIEIIETARRIDNNRNTLSDELKRDSFTKLYNHATFYEALDHEILRHQRTGRPFSLILMDLDDFKGVNDTFGHDMGDSVILCFVDTLNAFREGQPAFRYGGEEFIIIARHDGQGAMKLAERLRREFRRTRIDALTGRNMTVSIGICEYDDGFGGRREFFSAVDQALYAAKKGGKDRCEFYQGRIDTDNDSTNPITHSG